MAISDWEASERPREKLLARGPEALSDAELLAIFLRTGIKGKTAIDMARDLLKKFKGLRNLVDADWEDFCLTPGLGIAKFAQLQASQELGRRYLEEIVKRQDALLNVEDTHRYLTAKLRQYRDEVFACLCLDVRLQVIHFEILSRGTPDSATVYPRQVAAHALKWHASSVIIAHNHPSGRANPSEADKQLTNDIIQALAWAGMRLLDHVIIGEGETMSFAEHGLIEYH